MKTVRKTLRHDFDTKYVQKLLEKDELDGNDAKRILGEAVHVISALRRIISCTHDSIEDLRDESEMQKNSQWM